MHEGREEAIYFSLRLYPSIAARSVPIFESPYNTKCTNYYFQLLLKELYITTRPFDFNADNGHSFLAQSTNSRRTPTSLMRTLHYQLCAVADLSFLKLKKLQLLTASRCFQRYNTRDRMICSPGRGGGGGTLGISGWGCVAGTLEPLTYYQS